MRSHLVAVRCILVGVLCIAPAAYGYVDPGSGLLLIQGFLAVIGGAVVFIRNPVQAIKGLIRRLRRRRDA